MKEFRQSILDKIKENRPKLGESSAKTYVSILFNLHKKLAPEGNDNLTWFDDVEHIIDKLKDIAPKVRKTTLSALFILTKNDKYQVLMMDDCKVANVEYREQKKDGKEAANWVEVSQIKTIYDRLLEQVKQMFAKKMIGNPYLIMEFFLIALLGGTIPNLPPRRSLDYGAMKIRNFDTKTDNYYKAGKFYFNRYKTQSIYGTQILDVPKELDSIIKKWIKLNDTDYLLYSSNKQPLSSPQITRILNKVFDGKKVSTDLLRHIFLTDKYKDVPALSQMDSLAAQMGHSVNQAMLYVKKS